MDNGALAQQGLSLVKQAILNELTDHPAGLSNVDLVHRLGLASDFGGKYRNYLTWSVLGLLVGEGRVTSRGARQDRVYLVKKRSSGVG